MDASSSVTRKNFPLSTIKARLDHAGWQCELIIEEEGKERCRCPAIVSKGKFQADHHLEDFLGGKPTFENCRILCIEHHAEKTARNAAMIAKVRRQEAKDMRVKIVPSRPMQSPPPTRTEKTAKRVPKPPVQGLSGLARQYVKE